MYLIENMMNSFLFGTISLRSLEDVKYVTFVEDEGRNTFG